MIGIMVKGHVHEWFETSMPSIDEYLTDERFDTDARCEADHQDGGVCLSQLRPNGDCMKPEGHK